MNDDMTYQNETITEDAKRSEGVSKDNPYQTYRVTFPYHIKFSFEDDDHNTEVIIKTKSVEYYFGKDKQDVVFQKELSDRISDDGLKKHLLKFIEKRLYGVIPEICELRRLGKPEIEIMTQEEIDETERELISIGN